MNIIDLPWWVFSPSPFTIAFYIVLISISARILRRRIHYERFPRISAITDSFFILGFFVLFADLLWVIVCALRFGMLFFDSLPQLLMCGGRDSVGMFLCSYWVKEAQKRCVINIDQRTSRLLFAYAVFLVIWFLLAPNPAFTDWTYALRHNYPCETVILSFSISHILGKFLIGCAFLSVWF